MNPARVVRILLLAYPLRFRERFGTDMVDALTRDHEAARRLGRWSVAGFWMISVAHAIWFGALERLAPAAGTSRVPDDTLRRRLALAFTVDMRDAWRSLVATPMVTVVAICSLALGIAANLTLFWIANGLLLKPLPVHDPARLVVFGNESWTNPIWEQIRDRHAELFDGAFAWSNEEFDLAAGGTKDLVEGAYASGRVFETLGVAAFAGRTFSAADDRPGGGRDGPVAMISYALWQRRFGGVPDIVGRQLNVDRIPVTIVGVTPPGFFGAEVGRAWHVIVPLGIEAIVKGRDSALHGRSVWWLQIMARLRRDATLEQTAAALAGVQPQIREATRPHGGEADRYLTDPFTLSPAAGGRSTLRERYAQPLRIIMAVVAAVLLIACANIANLLLARASARRHELSVRLALGASRWRIARQLFGESLMLASGGTALGMVLAIPASAALMRQFATAGQAPSVDLSSDWRVALFTIGVACATALLFGTAPAVGVSQMAPGDALKEQGRSVAGDRRVNLRSALVVAQVALSFVLVVSAGLFMRTFVSLVRTPLGFDPRPLVVMNVDLQRSAAPSSDRAVIYERLRETAAGTPGVESVGVSIITPISGAGWNAPIEADGAAVSSPPAGGDARRRNMSWVNAVSPDWFSTYQMRLIAGRSFGKADRTGSPGVTVVNEAFVQRFFPGQNPLGRLVRAGYIAGPGMSSFEVVGVVTNAIYRSARAGTPVTMYVPLAQTGALPASVGFTLRTALPDAQLRRDLADAFTRLEPAAAFTFRRMDDLVGASRSQERLLAVLSGGFGGIAVVLAALGLYGVTSYWVSRRRSEIGIRLALGASRGAVAQLVMRRVASVLAIGVLAGLLASLWAARFVGALLFGLEPRDLSTMLMAAAVLTAVGAIAGWLPARRAARADPMHVLRNS
jgi:putative ABC transport system permease protein